MSRKLVQAVTSWACEHRAHPQTEPVVSRTWMNGYIARFTSVTVSYNSFETVLMRRGWQRALFNRGRYIHPDLTGAMVIVDQYGAGPLHIILNQLGYKACNRK